MVPRSRHLTRLCRVHRTDKRFLLLTNMRRVILNRMISMADLWQFIASNWGVSDNNRKAKYYLSTRPGQKQVEKETQEWEQMTAILARFFNPAEGMT